MAEVLWLELVVLELFWRGSWIGCGWESRDGSGWMLTV